MKIKFKSLAVFAVSFAIFSCESSKQANNNAQVKVQKQETIKSLNKLAQVALPQNLKNQYNWEFDALTSDDFNYKYVPSNKKTIFGNGKWSNFFNNAWDGPGTTYWKYNHVAVNGSDLVINTTRWNQKNEDNPISRKPNKMGFPEHVLAQVV